VLVLTQYTKNLKPTLADCKSISCKIISKSGSGPSLQHNSNSQHAANNGTNNTYHECNRYIVTDCTKSLTTGTGIRNPKRGIWSQLLHKHPIMPDIVQQNVQQSVKTCRYEAMLNDTSKWHRYVTAKFRPSLTNKCTTFSSNRCHLKLTTTLLWLPGVAA